MRSRSIVILLAVIFDALFGEPPSALHPVVWIGKLADRLSTFAPTRPRPQLIFGLAEVALVSAVAALAGSGAASVARWLPPMLGVPLEAWALKTAFSVRALAEAAQAVEHALDRGDLTRARQEVRALVSRDTDSLDSVLLTSAAVESVAENGCDSFTAPLMYYAIGGLPATFLYRAANTLDAMVGYRGDLEYLGKAAARLDDLLNLVPARLTALQLVAAAALAGGSMRGAWRVLRADGGRTESPNAGRPMSAMAGALGVTLTKPGVYLLGDPLPAPDTAAIDHALQILYAAVVLGLPFLAVLCRVRVWLSRGHR